MTDDRKQRGDAFRDRIATLVALKYSNVRIETNVSGKVADLLFEDQDVIGRKTYAVEAKAWSGNITQTKLATIVNDYLPAVVQGSISGLLIVAQRGITSAARQSLPQWAKFYTEHELQEHLVGLGDYVRELAQLTERDGLIHYYIKPRFEGDVEAITYFREWLLDPDHPALAILGGYGTGKTSFAKHISADCAHRYLADPSGRIPILVDLGAISAEQDLEGLLGKLFTSTHSARDFDFRRIMELNRLGRLLFVLDGFDEMKHAISWDEFKFNFQQINRLVEPLSKVVILGRPGALTSEDEHNLVFRGSVKAAGGQFQLAQWPIYQEFRLQAFDNEQVQQFCLRYLSYKLASEMPIAAAQLKAAEQSVQVQTVKDKSLLVRPVHTKMLADLVVSNSSSIVDLNEYGLYRLFMDNIIERETSTKRARVAVSSEKRRRFIQLVAWWLWTEKRSVSFSIVHLEEYLRSSAADTGSMGNTDFDEAQVREMLIGSCLDLKERSQYYFPHRSFQEFLVAEFIEDRKFDGGDLPRIGRALTEEVTKFLLQNRPNRVRGKLAALLPSCSGPLTLSLIEFLAELPEFRVLDGNSDVRSDDQLSRLVTAYNIGKHGRERPNTVVVKEEEHLLPIFMGLLLSAEGNDRQLERLLPTLTAGLLNRIGPEGLSKWATAWLHPEVLAGNAITADILRTCFKAVIRPNGICDLAVDCDRLVRMLLVKLWGDTGGSLSPFSDSAYFGLQVVPSEELVWAVRSMDAELENPLRVALQQEVRFDKIKVSRKTTSKRKDRSRERGKYNRLFQTR